jgi:uncharacterized protein YmfQ (DUF2313 family)
MRATVAQYLRQLLALLPQGFAWPRGNDTVLAALLGGLSGGLTRNHNRAVDLIDEADPRMASESLPDWERVTGLPDACSAGIATTLQERRAAVVARLTATGGQSIAYFTAMIAALGYLAEIDEYRPFICGLSRCGDRLNGPSSVRHYWRARITEPRVTRFRCGVSQCGDRLAKITRAEDLECLLARRKPAHTIVIVSYEGA